MIPRKRWLAARRAIGIKGYTLKGVPIEDDDDISSED